MTRRQTAIFLVWSILFAGAIACDRSMATEVHQSGLDVTLKTHWAWLIRIARLPGSFLTYSLVVAVLFAILGQRWWPAAAFVFVSGLLTAANSLVKWIVGRTRPFQGEIFQAHPFVGGPRGLGGPNQSFPSGDVCLAAATSGALMILFPRWRIMWAIIVIVVMAERIAENAHYPSDTVAAVGLGWLLAQLAWRLTGCPVAPKMPERNAEAGGS